MRPRRDAVLQPEPQLRVVLDAVLLVLQPAIPPAHGLLQETDGRGGDTAMRIEMAPGADDPLARAAQILGEVEHRRGIAVGPAAHRHHRALDRAVILADRAMLPE